MKIKIYKKENSEFVGEIKVRKNIKNITIIEKIKEYISNTYHCETRRMIPTGRVDFATGESDISYVLFGENLPFRNIFFTREEE